MNIIAALNKFTKLELQILFYIQFNLGSVSITQQELAFQLKACQSRVGKALRKLEKQGILRYTRDRLPQSFRNIESDVRITMENFYVH